MTNYLTNSLDILMISLFVYSFLLFLRRTRSYMVFLGLAMVIFMYFIARELDLSLTYLALRYFVGASVVVLVVIFQTEIRKYFELLGVVGSRQVKVGSLAVKSPVISELVQACVKMAQKKVGALIVIEGHDSIDTYIDGGTDLDGVISEEVLESIFDPHTEGHDGAVVIRNNRIWRFGSHLPLSSNFKEIGKHGTRHSAALGLAESTDALIVVVSEEKGTIAISKTGRIKILKDYSDLETELERYIKVKFSSNNENIFYRIATHNFWLKAGSVIFAFTAWYLSRVF